jgi:hypothetical protein
VILECAPRSRKPTDYQSSPNRPKWSESRIRGARTARLQAGICGGAWKTKERCKVAIQCRVMLFRPAGLARTVKLFLGEAAIFPSWTDGGSMESKAKLKRAEGYRGAASRWFIAPASMPGGTRRRNHSARLLIGPWQLPLRPMHGLLQSSSARK